jgi:hypothetical protein
MSRLSDLFKQLEGRFLSDFDHEHCFCLAMDSDSGVTLGVCLNPVRSLFPIFQVIYVDEDGEAFTKRTMSFKKAFDCYNKVRK